ncbi:hypothetical protein ILYODFUR_034558, partial [Ilyodon furcidens]
MTHHLAEDLNCFFCWFDYQPFTSYSHTKRLPASPKNNSTAPSSLLMPGLKVKKDINRVIQSWKKALGLHLGLHFIMHHLNHLGAHSAGLQLPVDHQLPDLQP